MICERCHAEIYKYSTCRYCHRKICNNCVKSSKRVSKTLRIVICKDCWTNTAHRKAYKSATAEDA
jgi:hypothetical protein